jgi:hypothetical protein
MCKKRLKDRELKVKKPLKKSAGASLKDPFGMLSIDLTCMQLESYSRTRSSRYLNEKSLITPSSVVMTKL